MGKRLLCAVPSCLWMAATLAFAQASSTAGFRGVQWGASPSAVKVAEKAAFLGEDTSDASGLLMVKYHGAVGNLDCIFAYYFASNQLVQGRYIMTESHQNPGLFIEDFKEVDRSLEGKYGKPTRSITDWKNSLYKSNLEEWGMAVSAGHLVFETYWALPDKLVDHFLTGDNFEVQHIIYYTSSTRAHQKLMEDASKKAKANVL